MYTLITGASSGIGLELAKICARNGQDLILVARSEDQLKVLAKDLKNQYSIDVQVIPKDLSRSEAVNELVVAIKSQSLKVENLVNNAGFGDHGPFVKADLLRQKEMIQLNITSLTELTHRILPMMLENRKGRILNVASTAAFIPGPFMSVYYATKAYVLSFSEALREELVGTGVTVTALCPGPTISGFQKAANFSNAALLDTVKLPTAEEVAKYGFNAMMKGQAIAIQGFLNKLSVATLRVSPRSVVTKLVKRLQEKRS